MSIVMDLPTESSISEPGMDQAVDLCQLIDETTSEDASPKTDPNAYSWPYTGRARVKNRGWVVYNAGQKLPDWLQSDIERLFYSGSKAKEICQVLPVTLSCAMKHCRRLRSKRFAKPPSEPPGGVHTKPEMSEPQPILETLASNSKMVSQEDPILIDDDDDDGGSPERTESSMKSPLVDLQLSAPSTLPPATVSIPVSVSCTTTGPTIARVSSLCQPSGLLPQQSFNSIVTNQQPMKAIPISLMMPNSSLGVPGFGSLGNTVLIMNTPTEPKWFLATTAGSAHLPSTASLPVQSSAGSTPANAVHFNVPGQDCKSASAIPSAPTSLTTCTSLWPGQIHRLLLNSPDPSSNGASQNSDLAIVYLGHNCWRPVILPRGFQASGQLVSLTKSTTPTTGPDSVQVHLQTPSSSHTSS